MADALDRKLRAFEKKMAKRWNVVMKEFDKECRAEFKKQKLPALFEEMGEDDENYLEDTIAGLRLYEY